MITGILGDDVLLDRLLHDWQAKDNSSSSSSPSPKDAMLRIKVKVAANSTCFDLDLDESDTVLEVKLIIQSLEPALPSQPDRVFLFYNGSNLYDEDQTVLQGYRVEQGSTIYVVVCPLGFDPYVSGVKKDVMLTHSRCIALEMKPWYTGNDIKAVIESLTGCNLNLDEVVVYHDNNKLVDSLTLADCNISKKCPVYICLHPASWEEQLSTKFQICVRDGVFEEEFLVSDSTSVHELKKKIEGLVLLKPENQLLHHGNEMIKMEDSETLGYYNVKDKDTIWLFLPGCLNLFLKTPQVGTTTQFAAYNSVPMSSIKIGVMEKFGVPTDSQTLVYGGMFLDEVKTLEHYKVDNDAAIYAIFGKEDPEDQNFIITVASIFHGEFLITVKPSFTIADVKAVTESSSAIPVAVQELYCNCTKLNNLKTVSDYGIGDLSALHVEIAGSSLDFYINTEVEEEHNAGKTFMVTAKTSNTLEEVLDIIPKEEVDSIDGEPALFLDDVRLGGNYMLAQYGIQSGAILFLDRVIQINVTVPGGAIIKVDLKARYDIKTVKTKVKKFCSIPEEVQSLSYNEDELDDNVTLEGCESLLGSLWNLRWKSGGKYWSFFWPSYDGRLSRDSAPNKFQKMVKFF